MVRKSFSNGLASVLYNFIEMPSSTTQSVLLLFNILVHSFAHMSSGSCK